MIKALLVLPALALLAACSTSAKPTSQSTSSSVAVSPIAVVNSSPMATKPKPPPAPTVWTAAQAKVEYLTMVVPGNRLIDQASKFDSATTPLATIKSVCTQLAASDDTLARRASSGLWPQTARAAVAGFVSALATERSGWQNCAVQTTAQAAIAAANARLDVSPKAELVRIALGLPGTS